MFELNDLRGNFNYYYDFYISAKEKSYSEAGRKHSISQSSLSRSVQQLENILDLKLLKTNNKGFKVLYDNKLIASCLSILFILYFYYFKSSFCYSNF